ncbi:uncharacterized protein P884DRAFT_239229 [Thermothelomyces heterothallicus CBS 202.75]|uniref:uncharacterized protein n=1 Tax=Thermothelomyces heterothallicus CBS 202.75 TaxID=1149848 RepID=UPI0037446544
MPRGSATDADESVASGLIAYCVVLLVVVLVVVSLRLYIRLRLLRKAGNDDIALGVTVVATIADCIGVTYATRLGLGRHIDTLSLEERSHFLKLVFLSSMGYHVVVILLKTTFLLQFRRVFPLPAFQRLCDVFLVFLGLWTVAGIVGGTLVCLPVSKNWDLREPIWTCDARFYFWMAHGVIHLVSDVAIFVMPLPLLKTLPLPPPHKVVLVAVFCLGFLTCVISALRLTTLHASLQERDVTWTSAKTIFWSVGEVACSIVCLCIPTLRPLMGSCCCSHRLDDTVVVERGTRRFGFYAVSLPGSDDPPATSPPPRTKSQNLVTGNNRDL